MRNLIIPIGLMISVMQPAVSQGEPEIDNFSGAGGTISITFLGHGTLMIDAGEAIIQVDPVKQYGNYKSLPKADIILITHEHGDHLDKQVIKETSKTGTVIICNKNVFDTLGSGTVMNNGDTGTAAGIGIEAVPAYNTTSGREKFHPKGRDNGYILTVLGKRIYIAGDTEVIPEMREIKNIDIAFLPMNQPYTMTPEQAAEAAAIIQPKVLYPYHYGNSDTGKLVNLLKSKPGIDVRIRNLQ